MKFSRFFVYCSGSVLLGLVAAYYYSLHTKDKIRRKTLYMDIGNDEEEDVEVSDSGSDEEETKDLNKDILVLGLTGSGKSTLLASLSGNPNSEVAPTDGFHVVSLPGTCDTRINLFELGGSRKNQRYWKHFFTDKRLVVFVVDASRQETFPEAKELLQEVLDDVRLRKVPFILVAHKQDQPFALDGDTVLRYLNLKILGRTLFPMQTQTPVYGTHLGIEELKDLIIRWA